MPCHHEADDRCLANPLNFGLPAHLNEVVRRHQKHIHRAHRVAQQSRSCLRLGEAWIEQVAKAVAEEVEPEDGDGDRDSGNEGRPHRQAEIIPPVGDQLPEARRRRLDTEADERNTGLDDDRDGDVVGSHHEGCRDDVRNQVLGDDPSGRLHKTLVETKKASSAFAFDFQWHDPTVAIFGAEVRQGDSLEAARDTFVQTIEGIAANPPTKEEAERARAQILKNIELQLNNSDQVGLTLSECWNCSSALSGWFV